MLRGKTIAFGTALTLLVMGGLPVFAATQGPSPTAPSASTLAPMPLDGTWTLLDEFMLEGDFFSGTWVWDSAETVSLTVTDWAVVSDRFEIYDNGALIATTPAKPDWDAIGKSGPFDPPSFITDPDTALASGNFSNMTINLGPGHHEITIRSIHIPPIAVGGPPFVDSTVAFKAEVQQGIPTVSQWGLIALALSLLIGARVYFGRRSATT